MSFQMQRGFHQNSGLYSMTKTTKAANTIGVIFCSFVRFSHDLILHNYSIIIWITRRQSLEDESFPANCRSLMSLMMRSIVYVILFFSFTGTIRLRVLAVFV